MQLTYCVNRHFENKGTFLIIMLDNKQPGKYRYVHILLPYDLEILWARRKCLSFYIFCFNKLNYLQICGRCNGPSFYSIWWEDRQNEHMHAAERCDWKFATKWKLHFSLWLIVFFKVMWSISCLKEHSLLVVIEGNMMTFMCLFGRYRLKSGFPRKWGGKSK